MARMPSELRVGTRVRIERVGDEYDVIYQFGPFATAEEAARAYDRAALHFYGSKALLNFPEEAAHFSEGSVPDLAHSRVRVRDATVATDARDAAAGEPIAATAEEAARAYDRAARQIFGSRAILNFPEEAPHIPEGSAPDLAHSSVRLGDATDATVATAATDAGDAAAGAKGRVSGGTE